MMARLIISSVHIKKLLKITRITFCINFATSLSNRLSVSIQYKNEEHLFAEFHLGQQWQIRPNPQLLNDLQNLIGKNAVQVVY
jgi:hypothetical protein